MSEADEIAESLYSGYIQFIGRNDLTTHNTAREFVRRNMQDEHNNVLDAVAESLHQLTLHRNYTSARK